MAAILNVSATVTGLPSAIARCLDRSRKSLISVRIEKKYLELMGADGEMSPGTWLIHESVRRVVPEGCEDISENSL